MEGPQPQKETARADSFTHKLGPVMDLFWVLGGAVFIVLFSYILIGLTYAVYYLPGSLFRVFHLEVDSFASFLFCLDLTALFMVVVYLILPVRMDKMRDALVQGAGLVLLVYPIMIVLEQPFHAMDQLGIETPYWFIYSIVGLLLLIQPWPKRVSFLGELPQSVLTALGLCLGLLATALTLFLMFQGVIGGTYSAVLITASLAVAVFTVMYAIHSRAPRIKSAPPQQRPQGLTGAATDSPVLAHEGVYSKAPSSPSRLVLWLIAVYSPAVLVGVDSGVATVIISAPLWIFAASEGTGIIWVFLGLVSRPDSVPVIVLSILATSIIMTLPVLLPTIVLELIPRRRDWLEYARFMILVHPAFVLFIEAFFLATGAGALVVPVPLAALAQYLRYRQLRLTLRVVSRGMLLASPIA